MQCIKHNISFLLFKNFKVFFKSFSSIIPKESKIGFLNFLINSNNKKLSLSVEEILKIGIFNLLRNNALSISNGVDKNSIFNLLQ